MQTRRHHFVRDLLVPRRWGLSCLVALALVSSVASADPGDTASEETGAQQWSPLLPRLAFTAPSLIVDPLRDRLILYGGDDDRSAKSDVVWVRPLSTDGIWRELAVDGPAPKPRMNQAAVYDSRRDRMVVYGGWQPITLESSDVWALELAGAPRWAELTPAGEGPGARIGAQAAYDPIGDRVIVVGGHPVGGVAYPSDVWILHLSEPVHWTKAAPAGAVPPPREDGAMIYDPRRHRMILFGGCPGTYGLGAWSDTWALSLGDSMEWERLEPGGGPIIARHSFAAAYDPSRDRLLVFSGRDGARNVLPDLWALTLSGAPSWSQIQVLGDAPSPRYFSRAVFDVTRDRMLLYGGTSDDLWLFSENPVARWTPVDPASGGSPYGCPGAAAAADPAHGSIYVFGGRGGYFVHGSYFEFYRGDLWKITPDDTPRWSLVVRDSTPSARWGCGMAVDPVGERLILFGGYGSVLDGSVWQLPLGRVERWSRIPVAGPAPGPRWGHSMIYDSAHHRLVIFGGRDVTGLLAETWSLDLDGTPAWRRMDGGGVGPLAREGHCAVYDPDGHRMVLFGGSVGSNSADDTWELSLSGTPLWAPIATPVRPLARSFAACAGDGLRRRCVIMGGRNAGAPLADAWTFDLAGDSGWEPAAVEGLAPSSRWGAVAAFDAYHDRMVLFGGTTSETGPPLDETWIMTSSVPVPSTLGPARAEAHPGRVTLSWRLPQGAGLDVEVQRLAAFDDWTTLGTATAAADGEVTYVDENAEPGMRYGYRLRWKAGPTTRVSDPTWVLVPHLRLALYGSSPNPSSGVLRIGFALPDAAHAELELMDVAGRRVWRQAVGDLGPGEHSLPVVTREPLRPGVYVIRLAHGRESSTRRVTVLQ